MFPLSQPLSDVDVRILGSLVEKELSTPEHYPLSLNALTAACNQSSNRDPVMQLEEGVVSAALDNLRSVNMVRSIQASGSRVPKYQHLVREAGEFSRAELAALCVLMLRGAQTLGEIRSRAARLMPGDDASGIEPAVESLIARGPAAPIAKLARKPGQKEARYAHLLSGDVAQAEETPVFTSPSNPFVERIVALEEQTEKLRAEIDSLKTQLAEFRKQFD